MVVAETAEQQMTESRDDDVVGDIDYGAGVPDDWVPVREFARRFGHGQTAGAARKWFQRQRDAGYVTEVYAIGRDRYVTEEEIVRFAKRRVRLVVAPDPDAL